MNAVSCRLSISLDGFVAGPNQSVEQPLGEGGSQLHEWAFATRAFREQHGLEDVGQPVLEPIEVVASPGVTHLRYRVVH